MENQLRKVHTSIELLVAHRRDLAAATGSFSKSAAILGNAEEHTGLARAMAQLSDVEDKVSNRLLNFLIYKIVLSLKCIVYIIFQFRSSKCIMSRRTRTTFCSPNYSEIIFP